MEPESSETACREVPFPPDFLRDGGMVRVPPYETTKEVNVKKRWRGRALAEVFATEFKLQEGYLREAAADGRLLVNRNPCQAEDVLANGDFISHRYTVQEPPLLDQPVQVLAESEHLLVVDKPAGMPCHPQGKYHRASLIEIVRRGHLGDAWEYIHPVNRLDRPTSGVVLLAKTRKGYMAVSRELTDMHKLYVARVQGDFSAEALARVRAALPAAAAPLLEAAAAVEPAATGCSADAKAFGDDGWHTTCSLPLRLEKHRTGQPLTTVVDLQEGKPASTRFKLLSRRPDGTSVVLCRPITGRTHQIRVHLACLGLPIVGDALYGGGTAAATASAGPPVVAAVNGEGVEDDEEGAALCLHAVAYGIRVRSDGATVAEGAAAATAPGGTRDAGGLGTVLPLPHGASALPDFVVYRCQRKPAWLEADTT